MSQNFNQDGYDNYPLGFRNNNPGNLRSSNINWKGSIGANNGFVVFENMAYGIRAAATVLINNISSMGNDTITKLITKYAPPSENNTDAYIAAVSSQTGIDPNATLDTTSDTLTSLLHAIFTHENGSTYSAMLTDGDIAEGLSMLSPQWLIKLQGTVTNFFAENPTISNNVGWILPVIVIVILVIVFRKNLLKLAK